MQRSLLLLFLFFTLPLLHAQTPMFMFGNPATSGSKTNYPFGSSATGTRCQTVYNPGSFGSLSGLAPINRLYFYADTLAVDTITYSTMVITLGEYTTPPSLGFAWMTPPANATQVLNGTNVMIMRDSGWFYIDLPSPYIYDASNALYLDIVTGAQTPFTTTWAIKMASGSGFLAANNPGSGSPNSIYLGSTVILGLDIFTGTNNAGLSTVTLPSVCGNNQDAQVMLSNSGTNALTSATIDWSINGTMQAPVYFNGNLDSFGSANSDTILTLGNVSFFSGVQSIKAWVSNPNSSADPFPLNDTVNFTMGSALNGTYTIGTSGNFASIADAVNALSNYGVCAPVTFLVDAGTYFSQVEIVGRINGASPVNTITFQGVDRDNTVLSWSALAVNSKHVVKLQNTAYITFRDLTVKPTGSVNAWGFHLLDSCMGIGIKNCVIDLSSAASSIAANATAGITVSGNATGICIPGPCATPLNSGTRSDSLQIDSNTIMYGYQGINMTGTSAMRGKNNRISNNTILNAYQNSINLVYQENATIEHNTIVTGGAGVTNMGTGIYGSNVLSNSAATGTVITRNRIHRYTTAGISLASSQNTDLVAKGIISNNMIGGLEQSPDANGILLTDCKRWAVAHNTINRDFISTAAVTASGIRVLGSNSNQVSIVNNVFAISKAGTALPVHILDSASIDSMDRNVFYRKDVSNNQVLSISGTTYTLSNFQGARGFNSNSAFAEVAFKNDTNLSLQSTCGFPAGMVLPYVSVDMNNSARNNPPVVGAEENVPGNNNLAIMQVLNPVSPITAGPQTLRVLVRNLGGNAISSFNLTYQYNANAPFIQPVALSSALAPCDTTTITVSGIFFTSGDSIVHFTVYTDMPNGLADTSPENDTMRLTLYTPLIGTYSLGGPGADFPTFGDAAYALKTAGIQGAVTFLVNAGNYTEQLTLTGPVAGASPVNTITFDGVDNSTRSIAYAGNSGSKHTIQLDNTPYVTIRNLSVITTGSTWGYGIHITNGSNNCRVKNCLVTISGSGATNTTVNFNGIVVGGATPTSAARIDSLEIDSNTISYGYYGISIYASSGAANVGQFNKIRNNTVFNAQQYSIYLVYQQTPEVLNNTITCRGAAAGVGIYCNNVTTPATGNNRTSIIGNRISSYGAAGISMNSSANASNQLKGRILNNVIGGQEKSAGGNGLYLTSSTNWSICNNTISRDYITTTNANAAALRIAGSASASNGNTVVNNILAITGNGPALPLYTQVAGNTDTVNYNLYYRLDTSATNDVAYIGSSVSQAAFKIGTFNKNSVYYRPGILAASNLMPDVTDSASWSLNGRGTHLGYVTTDISGNPRPVTPYHGVPDIGAYEFTPTSLPPMARAFPDTIIGGTSQVFIFATDTVARIVWPVFYNGPSAAEVRQYSGELPPGIDTFFNYMYFYTRISPLPTGPDTLAIYYRDNWKGSHLFESGIDATQADTFSLSWLAQPISSCDTARNILNLPYYTGAGGYYYLSGTDGAIAVPVRLISFKGVRRAQDASLTWATASEKNAARFDIQRSADNRTWTTIGSVRANGNSNSVSSYHYTDQDVFSALRSAAVYYRLRSVDRDGSDELSGTVAIAADGTRSADRTLTVFPNPFNDRIYLETEVTEPTPVYIMIVDITGKEVYRTQRIAGETGSLIALEDLPALNAGIYFIQAQLNGTTQTNKLVKH